MRSTGLARVGCAGRTCDRSLASTTDRLAGGQLQHAAHAGSVLRSSVGRACILLEPDLAQQDALVQHNARSSGAHCCCCRCRAGGGCRLPRLISLLAWLLARSSDWLTMWAHARGAQAKPDTRRGGTRQRVGYGKVTGVAAACERAV